MRRYGVRILVAVLTFGLGVAFSFVFGTTVGVFSARETKKSHNWSRRDCPKKSRSEVLVPLGINNLPNAPLKLVDLGPTLSSDSPNEHLIRMAAQNESDRTITGFVVRGERVLASNAVHLGEVVDFQNAVLQPGEVRVIHILNDNETAVSLGVSEVFFSDGTTWSKARAGQ